MNARLADVIDAGAVLDADEREIAVLALQRIDALDQGMIDPSWLPELHRRVEEIQNGKAELLDYNDSHEQLRAELAARSR